jgi:hypothetical protein
MAYLLKRMRCGLVAPRWRWLCLAVPPLLYALFRLAGAGEGRSPWGRADGWCLLWIALASAALLAALAILVEWCNPSLKTVRQAARCLQLPVAGVIPDLERIEAKLASGGGRGSPESPRRERSADSCST